MVESVLIFVIRNFLATTVGITLERISVRHADNNRGKYREKQRPQRLSDGRPLGSYALQSDPIGNVSFRSMLVVAERGLLFTFAHFYRSQA
jgi:hypothetical protein